MHININEQMNSLIQGYIDNFHEVKVVGWHMDSMYRVKQWETITTDENVAWEIGCALGTIWHDAIFGHAV